MHWLPKIQWPGVGLTIVAAIMPTLGIILPVWLRWAILALGLLMIVSPVIEAAYLLWNRWQSEKKQKDMMPADVGYNFGLAAALGSLVAAIRHAPRVAVVACLLAWAGFGVDYWFGPPRTLAFFRQPAADQLFTMKDSPLVWRAPSPMPTEYTLSDEPIYIDNILVQGNNIGDREVSLDDVYLISEMTGERLDLHISYPGKQYAAKDLNPIPPGAVVIFFTTNFQPPLSTNEFLREWRTMTLIVRADGQDHRITFDEETIRNRMPKHLLQGPHVTLRNQN